MRIAVNKYEAAHCRDRPLHIAQAYNQIHNWASAYFSDKLLTNQDYFKKSSGVIPACFKIARKVPSGMSPG